MEYEIGSLADLISGSCTPHRTRAVQKPLTPKKCVKVELNVTPQHEPKSNLKKPKLIFTPERREKAKKLLALKQKNILRKISTNRVHLNEDDEAYESAESKDGEKINNVNISRKIRGSTKRSKSTAKVVKNKKRKTENDTLIKQFSDDSSSDHESDNELTESDNEINLKKELDSNYPPSEDEAEVDDKDADGLSEFQKAAEFRQKQTLNRLEKFGDDEASRTLFVGNVPISKKCKKDMKKIFGQYGIIESVRIRGVPVKDIKSNPKVALIKNELHPDRSTVLIYVKFKDATAVDKALVENNRLIGENHIRVSRSNASHSIHDTRKTIFVGNLPHGAEDEHLWKIFGKCGDISSVRVIREKKTQIGKGFGYVNFEKSDGVELALSLSEEELTLTKRVLRVRRYTQSVNKQRPQGKFQKQGFGDRTKNTFKQRKGHRMKKSTQKSDDANNFKSKAPAENFPLKTVKKERTKHRSAKTVDSEGKVKQEGKGQTGFIGFTAEKKKKKKVHKGDLKRKRLSKMLIG